MTDHFPRPKRSATSPEARVAELHRLCDADYASTAHLRALHPTWPARPASLRMPAEAPPAVRCPAATASDTSPCPGPVVVLVLGLSETGIAGCEHHAARLISTSPGTYPVALPHAPAGIAARVYRAADASGPGTWREGK